MLQFSKLVVLFLGGLLAGCQFGSRPMTDTKQGAIAGHGLATAIPEEVGVGCKYYPYITPSTTVT